VLASRSGRKEVLEKAVRRLGARELIALGSLGLKAASIAEGKADAYVSPGRTGKRWDACACDALVRAAGAVFSDRTGQPIDYRGDSLDNDLGVVIAPPKLHARVLATLQTYQTASPPEPG
jgi:3'(2'), 5'-bisphosphate nucleotidase